jgi:type IV pilus biogenesis protein CpaD/CtpE
MVDDGNGDTKLLITEQGCAVDKYLMNNIEYPMDLMGIREVHAPS